MAGIHSQPRWRLATLAVLSALAALLALAGAVYASDLFDTPTSLPKNSTTPAPAPLNPKNIADLTLLERQVQALVPKALAATVAIWGDNAGGSGVIVSKEGLVLTAAHVIGEPNQEVYIILPGRRMVMGRSLGTNHVVDGGLVQITTPGEYPFLPMGSSADLKPGQWVVALGHSGGYHRDRPPPVRLGRVLFPGDRLIGTDCVLIGGDSGGPLFDLSGHVVGIHSRIGGSTLANVHVPVDTFKQSWDRLLKGENWGNGTAALDSKGFHFTDAQTKSSPEIIAAFADIQQRVGPSTVSVRSNGNDSALGTVVSADGYILTKASELTGRITCRLHGGQQYEAKLVGVSTDHDLALLKIEAKGLIPVTWVDTKKVADPPVNAVGTLVVTPGLADRILAAGIISVGPRKIAGQTAMLGITLGEVDPREGGVRVAQVLPESGAAAAGLRTEDIITHINDKFILNGAALIGAIQDCAPGQKIQITLRRGEQTLHLAATLSKKGAATSTAPATGAKPPPSQLSNRLDRFPSALQHDTVLRPVDCGGPLANLRGQVLGINIARASRIDCLALPAAVILPLLDDLKAGKYPPPKPEK